MKIYDSHVSKYYRYNFNKTCGTKFNRTLFLFIVFCISSGFYFGHSYAFITNDLFDNSLKCTERVSTSDSGN